jgi:hypothetical protein
MSINVKWVRRPIHNPPIVGIPCFEYRGGLSYYAAVRHYAQYTSQDLEVFQKTGRKLVVAQKLKIYGMYLDRGKKACLPGDFIYFEERFTIEPPTEPGWGKAAKIDEHATGRPIVGTPCPRYCIQEVLVVGECSLVRHRSDTTKDKDWELEDVHVFDVAMKPGESVYDAVEKSRTISPNRKRQLAVIGANFNLMVSRNDKSRNDKDRDGRQSAQLTYEYDSEIVHCGKEIEDDMTSRRPDQGELNLMEEKGYVSPPGARMGRLEAAKDVPIPARSGGGRIQEPGAGRGTGTPMSDESRGVLRQAWGVTRSQPFVFPGLGTPRPGQSALADFWSRSPRSSEDVRFQGVDPAGGLELLAAGNEVGEPRPGARHAVLVRAREREARQEDDTPAAPRFLDPSP